MQANGSLSTSGWWLLRLAVTRPWHSGWSSWCSRYFYSVRNPLWSWTHTHSPLFLCSCNKLCGPRSFDAHVRTHSLKPETAITSLIYHIVCTYSMSAGAERGRGLQHSLGNVGLQQSLTNKEGTPMSEGGARTGTRYVRVTHWRVKIKAFFKRERDFNINQHV